MIRLETTKDSAHGHKDSKIFLLCFYAFTTAGFAVYNEVS